MRFNDSAEGSDCSDCCVLTEMALPDSAMMTTSSVRTACRVPWDMAALIVIGGQGGISTLDVSAEILAVAKGWFVHNQFRQGATALDRVDNGVGMLSCDARALIRPAECASDRGWSDAWGVLASCLPLPDRPVRSSRGVRRAARRTSRH
jgi:hypothetical protein